MLALVKKYVDDHPAVTYNDLVSAFPIQLSSKPLVRLVSALSANDLKFRRVFNNDVITLSDGTEVVVNNQVQEKNMPEILQIASNHGYTVTKI